MLALPSSSGLEMGVDYEKSANIWTPRYLLWCEQVVIHELHNSLGNSDMKVASSKSAEKVIFYRVKSSLLPHQYC